MHVAYVVNQYPKASHTFIRREIAALEANGTPVARFSLRRARDPIVEDADLVELAKTRVVLDGTAVRVLARLAFAMLAMSFSRPFALMRAAVLSARLGSKGGRGLLVHLVYLAEACVLLRWLRESGCSHVHAHFGTNSTTVAMLVRALGGPPYSFTVHGPEEFDQPEALGLREKIERASFVVGISDYGRSQLYRCCAASCWSKIHVVPCGVDASFLGGEAVAPITGAPRLVCIGRLCEQKGQLVLLAAAARLDEMGVLFELVLVGDGEMRGEIEAEIARLGLAHRVRITGWASGDAVRRELVAARALVLPSFAEGLPVVAMESLAMGRPVVATWIAGIPELVQNGSTGWLVPAGSVHHLVNALSEVLRAPTGELARLGDEGRRRVRVRHDAKVSARFLAHLLERAHP